MRERRRGKTEDSESQTRVLEFRPKQSVRGLGRCALAQDFQPLIERALGDTKTLRGPFDIAAFFFERQLDMHSFDLVERRLRIVDRDGRARSHLKAEVARPEL